MGLSRKQKIKILERQNMKCKVCGRIITLDAMRLRDWNQVLGHYPDKSVPSQAKFHHLKWRFNGGSDNPHNIIALCGRCHAKAHNYYKKYKGKP